MSDHNCRQCPESHAKSPKLDSSICIPYLALLCAITLNYLNPPIPSLHRHTPRTHIIVPDHNLSHTLLPCSHFRPYSQLRQTREQLRITEDDRTLLRKVLCGLNTTKGQRWTEKEWGTDGSMSLHGGSFHGQLLWPSAAVGLESWGHIRGWL